MYYKFIRIFIVVFALASGIQSCQSKKETIKEEVVRKEKPVESHDVKGSEVKVYYFHYTHRCSTCLKIEDIVKKTVINSFGDNVPFASINIDEEQNKDIASKYNVEEQTLIIVKNGKIEANLTKEAFLYGDNEPEKLKAEVLSSVKNLQ